MQLGETLFYTSNYNNIRIRTGQVDWPEESIELACWWSEFTYSRDIVGLLTDVWLNPVLRSKANKIESFGNTNSRPRERSLTLRL